VCFIGRPRVLQQLREHGLTLTDLDGRRCQVTADRLQFAEAVPADARPGLVLLSVKSPATAGAAAELGAGLAPGTLVLSLQNGISNARIAQQAAPTLQVLPGMVPYNIVELAPGAYHRATTGQLAALDDPRLARWCEPFERAGVPLDLHADMTPVQWGKLLLNLNNTVNALSGMPLRAQLLDRGYRRCFAALAGEALTVLERAGIEPARIVALSPRAWLRVLRLPTPLFRIVAARSLCIDAKARSSMADDLALGRRTEVDALCGEVVRLAHAHGLRAPCNQRMVELLDGAWPELPSHWPSKALCRTLGL